MAHKTCDPRFDLLMAALRHPDVELRVDMEVMRGALVRLGVLVDQTALIEAASERLLPLDQFAWSPGAAASATTSNTTPPLAA